LPSPRSKRAKKPFSFWSVPVITGRTKSAVLFARISMTQSAGVRERATKVEREMAMTMVSANCRQWMPDKKSGHE